jgi:hypothetical protein
MLFPCALSKAKSAIRPFFLPGAALLVILAPLALTTLAKSQAVTPSKPISFNKSLDLQAGGASDSASIRSLFIEIHSRNLFGSIPQSVLDRMVRAQAGFKQGTQAPVTEAAVADAVNTMGRELDPVTFTGTNALQVRLVRINRLMSLPTLLATGSPRPPDKIVANDMSPAGAVYLGLHLLHQKLANPAWFGDPDTQNKQWLKAKAKPVSPAATANVTEPPEMTNFRLALQGLANEGSTATKAYHHFLDALGVPK